MKDTDYSRLAEGGHAPGTLGFRSRQFARAKVFTTGAAASICHVCPRTVMKWIDSGRLKGYRLPGSPDRRVHRDELVRFLRDNGMSLGVLEDAPGRVVAVGCGTFFVDALADVLGDGWKVDLCPGLFDAGIAVTAHVIDALILDHALMGRNEAWRMAGVASLLWPGLVTVHLLNEDDAEPLEGSLRKPCGGAEAGRLILAAMEGVTT